MDKNVQMGPRADKKFEKWVLKNVTLSKSWPPPPPPHKGEQSDHVMDEFSPQKCFVFHL